MILVLIVRLALDVSSRCPVRHAIHVRLVIRLSSVLHAIFAIHVRCVLQGSVLVVLIVRAVWSASCAIIYQNKIFSDGICSLPDSFLSGIIV